MASRILFPLVLVVVSFLIGLREEWHDLQWNSGNNSGSTVRKRSRKPLIGANYGSSKANYYEVVVKDDRPRDLQIVFIGDSLMRYQYLSLAYFLRYGRWLEPATSEAPDHLVNAHSFHHPLHPHQDWNEFFLRSNRLLYPMEACDCLRSVNVSALEMERRYFYDPERNNRLAYINLFGHETHGSWGVYGRFPIPKGGIFTPDFVKRWVRPAPVGFYKGLSKDEQDRLTVDTLKQSHDLAWEYGSWGDVIRYHVGKLGFSSLANSTPVVLLNAGLHDNLFLRNATLRRDVRSALKEVGMKGVWKTTTFSKQDVESPNVDSPYLQDRIETDKAMCKSLHQSCFNISWTRQISPSLFLDNFHVLEPVYRILNEELLVQFVPHALQADYNGVDRRAVLE